MAKWTTSEMPPQKGRSAVVTGTGGLGFETALELARAGGEVIIAGRNSQKGMDAVARIRAAGATESVRFEQVDLASLKSVRDFTTRLRSERHSIDLLVNNAAVMRPATRLTTEDGFELQFGTNYLGHFALTAQLLPLLREGKDARVVTLSSIAVRQGVINFDDLQAEQKYESMPAYAQSKLACLMFALEMHRRSVASGWGISSIAAHPGISRTDLLFNGPGRWSLPGIARTLLWFLFQPAPQGALPTLFASTSPLAKAGSYYGPDKMQETRGFPALSKIPPQALDASAADRLWRMSEHLTGVTFQTEAASKTRARSSV
jgi:NAD(P)-dependent dehydrogenase (short-subunit alcohol dehydrogenase family)